MRLEIFAARLFLDFAGCILSYCYVWPCRTRWPESNAEYIIRSTEVSNGTQAGPASTPIKAGPQIGVKESQMETVGFIGLGNMGGGMAGNIQKAGYPMIVHDINEGATRPFLESGARLANSPADVASQCDVTCLLYTSPSPRD